MRYRLWPSRSFSLSILFADHGQIVQLETLRGIWGTKALWGRVLSRSIHMYSRSAVLPLTSDRTFSSAVLWHAEYGEDSYETGRDGDDKLGAIVT